MKHRALIQLFLLSWIPAYMATWAQDCPTSATRLMVRVEPTSVAPRLGNHFRVQLGKPYNLRPQVQPGILQATGERVWFNDNIGRKIEPGEVQPEFSEFSNTRFRFADFQQRITSSVQRQRLQNYDESLCYAVYNLRLDKTFWAVEVEGKPSTAIRPIKNYQSTVPAPILDHFYEEGLASGDKFVFQFFHTSAGKHRLFSIEGISDGQLCDEGAKHKDSDCKKRLILTANEQAARIMQLRENELKAGWQILNFAASNPATTDAFELHQDDPFIDLSKYIKNSSFSQESLAIARYRAAKRLGLKELQVCSPNCKDAETSASRGTP